MLATHPRCQRTPHPLTHPRSAYVTVSLPRCLQGHDMMARWLGRAGAKGSDRWTT